MGLSRYTLFLFQEAYPEQIKINKYKQKDDTISIEVWLLNQDKEPHMTLFVAEGFKSEEEIENKIQELLKIDLNKDG